MHKARPTQVTPLLTTVAVQCHSGEQPLFLLTQLAKHGGMGRLYHSLPLVFGGTVAKHVLDLSVATGLVRACLQTQLAWTACRFM